MNKIIRGDTLQITCIATDEDGQPCDLSIRDLQTHLRVVETGERIKPFDLIKDPDRLGVFYIQGEYADTAQYPVCKANFDFQETLDGRRTSSTKTAVTISGDITHD